MNKFARAAYAANPSYRWTIEKIEEANEGAGFYFFESSTKRFFRSRASSIIHQGPGGIYFVTSEQNHSVREGVWPRLFTVRRFDPETGDVSTAGEFQAFATRTAALSAARTFAAGEG
jgi:hypothetical protein